MSKSKQLDFELECLAHLSSELAKYCERTEVFWIGYCASLGASIHLHLSNIDELSK